MGAAAKPGVRVAEADPHLTLLADLLEAIPAPALAAGHDARIVFVNADARELPGLRGVLGCPAEEVLPEELLAVWRCGDDGIYHWVELAEACYYAACRSLPGAHGGQLLMLIPQGSPWHAMLHAPQ